VGIGLLFLSYYYVRHFEQLIITRVVQIQPARAGALEEGITVLATVIREEIPIIAPVTGKLEKLATEGQRVRRGAILASLVPVGTGEQTTPSKINLRATQPGIVAYHLDGLEKVLVPGLIDSLEADRVYELAAKANPKEEQVVGNGTAAIKIIANLTPVLLYIQIPTTAVGADWKTGKELTIKIQGAEEGFKARITTLRKDDDKSVIILSLPCHREFWYPRQLTMNLITNRFLGFILPGTSLVKKESKFGVYVLYRNKVQWREVEVLGSVGRQTAVEGLTEGASVIVNPRWVAEGKQLK